MYRRKTTLAGALLLGVLSLVIVLAASPNDQAWKDVEQAMNSGKPRTAIERLSPIIRQAIDDEKYAEAIKAIAMKISLEAGIEGNLPQERIIRMQAELEKVPDVMKPPMQTILANWYWNFFQQNRWRFAQRTQSETVNDQDMETWDLVRILREIDQHFVASLSNAETLKKIPIAEYNDLIEKGTAPDSYRPTLYDVLVHNAIEFYSSGEQAASRAYDSFELSADSPVFSSTQDFVGWTPDTVDEESLLLKAIRLYQQLLVFHQKDDDLSAFLDADLARLVFGYNQAFGEEKESRYEAALRRFAEKHADHVISSRAMYRLAELAHQKDEFSESLQIASEGQRRHPESVGGNQCFNLIQQIKAKSLSIATERVWNEPLPNIDVTYRNIGQVHFRLVAFDFDEFIRSNRWQAEQLDQNTKARLLKATPIMSWSEDLPKTIDFQEQVHSFPCPDDLATGSYYLIASQDAGFGNEDNAISFTQVWRSDLALVLRSHQGRRLIDGFVLDAKTGNPIAGAIVKGWNRGQRNEFVAMKQIVTDDNGRFEYAETDHRQVTVLAEHNGQTLSSMNPMHAYRQQRDRPSQQTLLFTDRGIYRPGQSIRFKGICISLQPKDDNYTTLSARKVVIALMDVNGKEVERLTLSTNDYGSFNGTFSAPRDRLTGQMTIRIIEGPSGAASISVEEYKRPKFQVEINSSKAPAKLLSKVQVEGKASAYTGASINGAKVQWRVVREVRFPDWWFRRCWWLPVSRAESQEIARGIATTDAGGRFEINFDAKPDPSALPESEPVFRFTIYADVTDSTGETRSTSRVINLGYAAINATLSAKNWLTNREPVEIQVQTRSLDGEPRPAEGSIEVFAVQQPEKITRPPLTNRYRWFSRSNRPEMDPTNPNSWPVGASVHQADFETDATGNVTMRADLPVGMYRVKLISHDTFGKEITAELPITVIDPQASNLAVKVPELFLSQKNSFKPGEEYTAIWGSGYDTARVFVEVEHRGRLLKAYWTKPGITQTKILQTIDEQMRGGFNLRTTMVRDNRSYTQTRFIDVPWSNKELKLSWEHFVSKLEPAAKETWTAIVSGPDSEHAVAEMVATLYDASLDAFRPTTWPTMMSLFRRDYANVQVSFENQLKNLQPIVYSWTIEHRDGTLTYRHFPSSLIQLDYGRNWYAMESDAVAMNADFGVAEASAAPPAAMMEMQTRGRAQRMDKSAPAMASETKQASPDLSAVSARKNLQETAFFFPQLMSSEDGTVKLQFTMPEALTEWRFLGFAHDQQLRNGLLTGTTVTAKDLMVEPNPPRFLREGDVIDFPVKVSNQSASRQKGVVRLTFQDARTGDSVDGQLENSINEQRFDIPSGESMTLSWRISVPDGAGFLIYRAVGSTGRLSDGEEGMLPVLSRRVLVTDSLPLPIRGKQKKAFRFDRLLAAGESDSIEHQSLTLQMVSNPSWYAVMSLPYLMEYPHECSEQVFNRLYANSVARHLAQSDPKIEQVFAQWRGTPALDSPLEKNQDLKAVMLEETPWVRQAENESQSRRQLGILFDNNRLDEESNRAMRQLAQMQLEDGAWPWFPGGGGNDYITLYVTTGFGRMRHLGVDIDISPAIKSLRRLDLWMTQQYEQLKEIDRKQNHLGSTIALYLYGRSFFLNDQPIDPKHRLAWDYWCSQAEQYWLELGNRQSQAHVALALKRIGKVKPAKQITDSLKERSISDDEMGMHWRDTELSWWWYRAPIETQAMMIEAFDEVADDEASVEDCKVWLLKQKQTQDWKTTKATADAIYALLLRGSDVLASDTLVEVKVAGDLVEADEIEAGTGFFEERWTGNDVKPEFGEIELKKMDEGVAWGSLYWQYLEDMANITPHDGTPLKITKNLFVKKYSPSGPKLFPVDGAVEVGDELVVRLVLKTDRDMEYVHLKDYRGSGTEPVNVISRYKFREGLAYYEATQDTASHFFIDYLPRGTYVFEYSTRVQLRGKYQTGYANIQCMYAPEFASHSESLEIEVR